MNIKQWNNYQRGPCTHDVANHAMSTGGVHLFQVRLTSNGWERRILQCKGFSGAAGSTEAISDAEGESYYRMAQQFK